MDTDPLISIIGNFRRKLSLRSLQYAKGGLCQLSVNHLTVAMIGSSGTFELAIDKKRY